MSIDEQGTFVKYESEIEYKIFCPFGGAVAVRKSLCTNNKAKDD